MVELEFKMELSDYRQLLSAWLKKEGLIILQILKVLGAKLITYIKDQYHFLRAFNYTKENIQAHLMQKAAKFFGEDLEESRSKQKQRNKPFSSKFRLKSGKRKLQKVVIQSNTNANVRKNKKNKGVNVYHARE